MSAPNTAPDFEWQSLLPDDGISSCELHSCVVEGISLATVSRIGNTVLADLRWDGGSGAVETFGLEPCEGSLQDVGSAKQLVEFVLQLAPHD